MSTIATVTSVTTSDDGRILVTVSETPRRENREVFYRSPGAGIWVVPSVGDIVELTALEDGSRVAHAPRNLPGFTPPSDLSEGDIVVKLNNDTFLQFSQQDDGTYNINLESDGDITVSAGGDIIVDNNGTPKSVLTEDAVFEYEQRIDTSGGGGGTQTKTTTTVSNGETTSTEID